jgi:hypothetical protein
MSVIFLIHLNRNGCFYDKGEAVKKLLFLIIPFILLLLACAPGGGRYGNNHPAGFFTGIWHGWIAPVCLIVQIFKPDIRIYEVANTGWWYDFGFYIAVISGFGSLSLTRHRKKKED